MTVAELIELLATQDPAAEAWLYADCHGCEKPVAAIDAESAIGRVYIQDVVGQR